MIDAHAVKFPSMVSKKDTIPASAAQPLPHLIQHPSQWVSLKAARRKAEEIRPQNSLQSLVPAEPSPSTSREESLSEIPRQDGYQPTAEVNVAIHPLTHRMPVAENNPLAKGRDPRQHRESERQQEHEQQRREQADLHRPEARRGSGDGGGPADWEQLNGRDGGASRQALLTSNAWALLCADSLAAVFAALALVRLSPDKDGADGGAAAAGPGLWASVARSWAAGLVFLLVLDYLCGYTLPRGFPA